MSVVDNILAGLQRIATSREEQIVGGMATDYLQYRCIVAELRMVNHMIGEIKRLYVEGDEEEEDNAFSEV